MSGICWRVTPDPNSNDRLMILAPWSAAQRMPAAIERRLETTARDLGTPGRDPHYGWGLVDAGAATAPRGAQPS